MAKTATAETKAATAPVSKPETQKGARERERGEARERLRAWIKPGDTVYTVLDSVSRSGMSRQIRVVLLKPGKGKGAPPVELHPNWAIGVLLGLKHGKRNGRELDSLTINGCGMDMGFHLVHELSYALYGGEGKGRGYRCLGKGKDGRGRCPSAYHSNHRDRLQCEGVLVPRSAVAETTIARALAEPSYRAALEADPDSTEGRIWAGRDDRERRRCYAPRGWFGPKVEIPEDWPRGEPVTLDNSDGLGDEPGPITIPGPLLTCLFGDDGEIAQPYQVCSTCKGEGTIENPEGPERWDLRHGDGYALRHRWL